MPRARRSVGVYLTPNLPQTMTTPKAQAARDATLGCVQAAHTLLLQASSTACDLRGWCDQYHAIGDEADRVQELIRDLIHAPAPTSHDSEPRTP